MKCPHCYSTGIQHCLLCMGRRIVLDAKGKDRKCTGCDGRGKYTCPLCVGKGLLPVLKVDGVDIRFVQHSRLIACRAALIALIRRAKMRNILRGPWKVAIKRYTEFLRDIRIVVPIPESSADCLRDIVKATISGKATNAEGPEYPQFYEMHLSLFLEHQVVIIDRCIWRILRNNLKKEPRPLRKKASAIKWTGWFGSDPTQPNEMYCLLGLGWMRAQSAENTGQVIQCWLREHPNAIVVPVAIMRPSYSERERRNNIYVWIEDGQHNLNIHLVAQGCLAAYTMTAFQPEIEISFSDYLSFQKRTRSAETSAKQSLRGIWVEKTREDHKKTGNRLEKEGKFEEALHEFHLAIQNGANDAYTWLSIANCREKLGRYEEALSAFDKAIGGGDWWPPYSKKALCMVRNEGKEKAVDWLKGLAEGQPKDRKYPYLIGDLLWTLDLPKEAIPYFRRAVELASAKHGFKFDDKGWLIVDKTTRTKENNDFCELWPTLENLADCCYAIKDFDAAFEFATMGVSIGQQLKRCNGCYGETEVTAGDAGCRIIRTKILIDQGRWELAEREIGHVRILANSSSYTGWKKQLRHLEDWMKKHRPKEKK